MAPQAKKMDFDTPNRNLLVKNMTTAPDTIPEDLGRIR